MKLTTAPTYRVSWTTLNGTPSHIDFFSRENALGLLNTLILDYLMDAKMRRLTPKEIGKCPKCGEQCGYWNLPIGCGK